MTVACVITIGVGAVLRCAMLNGFNSREQKAATAKSRKLAGIHMVQKITTNAAREQSYVAQPLVPEHVTSRCYRRQRLGLCALISGNLVRAELCPVRRQWPAAVNHRNTVHQHKLHSFRQLIWVFECCSVSEDANRF